jgi:hypothetical protein
MGIATFPAASGGLTSAVKSIQRGTAVSSGNITITAVDTTKTICNSFSTGSAGSVAASGTVNAFSGNVSATSTSGAAIAGTNRTVYTAQVRPVSPPIGVLGQFNPRYGVHEINTTSQAVAATNLAAQNINAASMSVNAMNITGGSTSLTSAVYGIHLVNSTTITATGPCRYEVVEYF